MMDVKQTRYLNAAESFSKLEAKENKMLVMLSAFRLLSFISGFIATWIGFAKGNITGSFLMLASIIIFLYLLKLYSLHSRKREFLANLATINKNEAEALAGNLSAFENGSEYSDPGHDFSNDVDLFGTSSLFQYLNRTVTGYGRGLLASWLSKPGSLSSQLVRRQEAVKDLSAQESWRHEFMATGLGKELMKGNIEGLLQWMSEPDMIRTSFLKRFLIYLLPAISILTAVLAATGVAPYQLLILIILINLLYVSTGLKRINRIHSALSKKYYYLSSVNELLKVFEKGSFTSEVLISIKNNISGNEISAALAVKKLGRLIQAFDARLNLLVSIVFNGLLLWDYHSVLRIEKWKWQYKDLFPIWLEMIGEADAYISLANYAGNNPEFAYPAVSEGKVMLDAKNLGHPLIRENIRISNDFMIAESGTICIISGANMAGKSTFLRTVAVNYILGMAGAPVCASGMVFTPFKLFTSMRTTDSLTNNESYFYAELKRLKSMKDRIEKGEQLLFILDEILKGTNSADKSMGSKLFLKRLTELGATGLIATHDTSVGEMEKDYPGRIINKCFEIEIDGDRVSFDYRLRDGITHKMNAALLMKQMGILD